jgi:hypothetical protein
MIKHLTLFVPGFTLSYIWNMCIFMMLNNFCLTPSKFYDKNINIRVRNFEKHTQIAIEFIPWKMVDGAETLLLETIVRRETCQSQY